MKKYTQQNFNDFEVIDGIKNCPTGDYTAINCFGEWCSFGERCSFGKGCSFENKKFKKEEEKYFIRINNIGSRNDGCYIFNCEDGLFIRSGCFFGSEKEFIMAVKKNHAGEKHEKEYFLALNIAKITFEV